MIHDSKKKLFDTVLVWKLDRFARNRYDSARYKAQLKKNGVKVVSATEAISAGAEGILLESVLEGMAEYYSADLADKVVRGRTENALKCKWNGGTVPLGYIVDEEQHLQPNSQTCHFVVDAFKLYDQGHTITEIRDHLNNKGVKNTLGRPMTFGSVQHMLSNRRYIGEYVYRDIVTPGGIPALVPQDLFDRVQEKLAKNKKAPARNKAEEKYLLTTKLFCGYCGVYMCGESGKSRNGVVHRYYKCATIKNHHGKCKKKSVKKEWIENLIVNDTMAMLQDDAMVEAIVSMFMHLQDQENTTLPILEQQLKETEKGIKNIVAAVEKGMFSTSLQQRMEELEAAKADLETRIEIEKLDKPRITAEQMTFWLHRFRKLDMTKEDHRQMLIDAFVNSIFVYDDKLLLTYNFQDGTRTITFDDVQTATEGECSDMNCSAARIGSYPLGQLPFLIRFSGRQGHRSPDSNGSEPSRPRGACRTR